MTPLLEIRSLSVSYGPVKALRDLDFRLEEGRIATLIGSNGAGKSTTLRAISGLLKPDSGEILYRGSSLLGMPAHRIVGMGLVHCPEGRGIVPSLSVMENLELGAYTRPSREDKSRDFTYVWELFPRLLERREQKAETLSGGEQQMLAIGRALMAKPKLLLLDEPSLGLAPQVVDTIFNVVQKINREGTSILLVEQNAHLALEISDIAYVLENGSLCFKGPAKEVAANKEIQKAYLGA